MLPLKHAIKMSGCGRGEKLRDCFQFEGSGDYDVRHNLILIIYHYFKTHAIVADGVTESLLKM